MNKNKIFFHVTHITGSVGSASGPTTTHTAFATDDIKTGADELMRMAGPDLGNRLRSRLGELVEGRKQITSRIGEVYASYSPECTSSDDVCPCINGTSRIEVLVFSGKVL